MNIFLYIFLCVVMIFQWIIYKNRKSSMDEQMRILRVRLAIISKMLEEYFFRIGMKEICEHNLSKNNDKGAL